jgi:predicted anti-sigma-YlaC factor YlaD
MTGKSCEEIQEMLVDYADGELIAGQSNEVAEHLETCENCRKLLQALGKSLELATVVWEDGLKETEAVKIPIRQKTRKIHWIRYAAVAAGFLIVVTTSIVWRGINRPQKTEISFNEIERNIAESANAARLLAATELLADYPDAKEIVQQQYSYIARVYPETPAAAKIKLKIQIN